MSRMMKKLLLGGACFVLLATPVWAGTRARKSRMEGAWQGSLAVSGVQLRIVFRIARKEDGTLSALMDSPDQGARGIAVDQVSFDGKKLKLEIKRIKGSFLGSLQKDGSLRGFWSQGPARLPLTLRHVNQPPKVRRPQEPKRPYPYREEEVRYRNPGAGITLAGTLTLPRGKGPFPAAVLISGSGPQDRDETVFGHRPFLVLADALTRHGLAVLRSDDRGVGGSGGKTSESTSQELAGDVASAIAFLKTRPAVDPGRIGLIGHSEGALVAPMVALRTPVAFMVLLAGPGVTGERILYAQAAALARAAGASEAHIAANRQLQEALFAVIREEPGRAAAETRLRQVFARFQKEREEGKGARKEREAFLAAQLKTLLSPWFRFFLTYDPRPALRRVSCPVLALIGERDLQVPARLNLPAIEGALRQGGNPDFTVKELPGLNHLFQHAKTGAVSEYGKIEETIAPEVLEILAEWIGRHTLA